MAEIDVTCEGHVGILTLMRRMLRHLVLWFVLLGAFLVTEAQSPPSHAATTDSPALPMPQERVVELVTQTIAWYRRLGALQQLPVDSDYVVPRDRLSKTALTAVQLAFDFGRAAALLAGRPRAEGQGATGEQQATPGQAGELDRAAATLAERAASLQSQLADVDQQLSHATAKDRPTLAARRAEVSAALELNKEIQATVGQLEHFEEMSDGGASGASGGLAAQIADLQRSVPEVRRDTGLRPAGAGTSSTSGAGGTPAPAAAAPAAAAPAAAAPQPATAPTSSFRPESAGVVALVGKWFSIEGARRQLEDAMGQTDALAKEVDLARSAVTQEARSLARENLLTTSTDSAQLQQAKQQLDEAVTRFRQLSTLLVPMGEEAITVSSARSSLVEWQDSLASLDGSVARFLALRLSILLGSIALVLFVSEIWRRATFRYLHDSRRRAQFLALRRVAIGFALVLVIAFGLVSEVGSLATYAGLITAGLAVALQNVILAVVAYFFLIGRYGVRVGDRITLAGVTGRVVEIGLIRIYLMELVGPELRSSGRMVVLSNAVLFQPTALFKQMPGGDFYWHTITLTLSDSADVQLAEKRLNGAAESVYEKYRPAIERQHAALQRFIDFETAMPRPEVYARLTLKGLECTVRYPVEPAQAASTDQQMLLALREAQSKSAELQLVEGPILDNSDH